MENVYTIIVKQALLTGLLGEGAFIYFSQGRASEEGTSPGDGCQKGDILSDRVVIYRKSSIKPPLY